MTKDQDQRSHSMKEQAYNKINTTKDLKNSTTKVIFTKSKKEDSNIELQGSIRILSLTQKLEVKLRGGLLASIILGNNRNIGLYLLML